MLIAYRAGLNAAADYVAPYPFVVRVNDLGPMTPLADAIRALAKEMT